MRRGCGRIRRIRRGRRGIRKIWIRRIRGRRIRGSRIRIGRRRRRRGGVRETEASLKFFLKNEISVG